MDFNGVRLHSITGTTDSYGALCHLQSVRLDCPQMPILQVNRGVQVRPAVVHDVPVAPLTSFNDKHVVTMFHLCHLILLLT
jgi:hypothetical protein